MKQFFSILALASAITVNIAQAQLPPSYDGKPASSGTSLSYSLPKSLSGFSLNFSDPKSLASFSLNFQPVMELMTLLEKRGAKITPKLLEGKNMLLLDLNVDGKQLSPILVQCMDCVIVYEY